MIEKNTPARDPAYLNWVRQQPSVISGQTGCIAHHPIGQRYSQSKCSDRLAFPLTPDEHMELHAGWARWEERHGSQWMFAARTLDRAVDEGFFTQHEPSVARVPRVKTSRQHSTRSPSKTVPNPLVRTA